MSIAKNDDGYIVIETIGAFMLFTFLVLSILSLISIVTLQARVHHALTQACEAVSMYSYLLDLTGAGEHIQNNSAKADKVQGHIDEFKTNVNGLIDSIENVKVDEIGPRGDALIDQVSGLVESTAANPKNAVQHLLNYGVDQGASAIFGALVRPLVGRYLKNGSLSGDQYLKNYGVENGLNGLEFYSFDVFSLGSTGGNDSRLLDAGGNVKIVVEYDVKYQFGKLPLPFEPKLHITQEVMTKAWLGGEGDGYKG